MEPKYSFESNQDWFYFTFGTGFKLPEYIGLTVNACIVQKNT